MFIPSIKRIPSLDVTVMDTFEEFLDEYTFPDHRKIKLYYFIWCICYDPDGMEYNTDHIRNASSDLKFLLVKNIPIRQ